jgi:Domain of unknown function (DUF5916)/Carbohydrate family 9 binding domain-like
LLAAAVSSSPATGQDRTSTSWVLPEDIPTVHATLRSGEVDLDGVLDETAWRSAKAVSRFVQGEPIEGAPAEEDTFVRVLFDESAIYVGAVMHEPDASLIGNQLVRRDDNGQYDYFEVSLDPNFDRRTGYQFRVSAAGVQRDVYLYDDTRDDDNWDAVWQSAVHRDSTGWSVEIRIPLSQLRYDPTDSVQTWGVNFTRRRLATNERSYFSLESRVRHGRVSVFGELQGLELPKSARRIEIRPYVLSSARMAPAAPGNPFFDGTAFGAQAGADVRVGIGTAFTLDLTVNPDFGQVEVDPAVINLSAFETFFPEKRPFFVEGAQIFDFTLSGRENRLFYSRRIGRDPHGGAPSESDFVDIPQRTAIQTAAKLTGRTASGLSVGALAGVTARETGSAYTAASGIRDDFTVEPRSQYGVVRVQQDLREGATQVGAIVTGTFRELPSDGSFSFLPSHAYSVGVDFEHNWGGSRSRDWVLNGYFASSLVKGSPEAITAIQRSSNHRFQRPDATRFSVDSNATSLTGVDWRLQFERQSARHWTGSVWVGQATPGFEINDLGFSNSTERLTIGGRLSYQEIRPGALFRDYRINAFAYQNFRHEALDSPWSLASWSRARKGAALWLNGEFEFLNYWSVNLGGRYSPASLSDGATRGGPLMVEPSSHNISLGIRTDPRKTISLGPRVEVGGGPAGSRRFETRLRTVFRPTPSWELEFTPEYSTQREPAQYVEATEDVGYQPTYGSRYIFSDLERRSLSFETRLNMAFTPFLTLQLFAQPLISSGDYLTYKQLARSQSFDFDVFEEGTAAVVDGTVVCSGGRTCVEDGTRYLDFDADGQSDFSFADRNFTVRSLRLNAVLRWEYRPGSTIYVVWQQGRSQEVNDGTFDVGRDVGDLFGGAAENMFIVKFNYWLPL